MAGPILPRMRRHLATLARIGAALVVLAACVWFVRGLDFAALGRALAGASIPLLFAAAAVNLFLHNGARALRLEVLLSPVARIPAWRLYRYSLASSAATNLLPARAGEALRVWLLKTREGVPTAPSVAVALVEKAFDLVAMLALALPIPLLLSPLPVWVGSTIWALAGICVLAAGASWALAHHGGAAAHGSLWRRFAQGTQVIKRPGPLALGLVLSLAAWVTDGLVMLLVLRAVHTTIPLAGPLLVLLVINLAIALPSTPAQVGAFEMGAVAALRLLGVADAPALAFGLLYHLVQMLPVTLAGLSGLWAATQLRAAGRGGRAPEAPPAQP